MEPAAYHTAIPMATRGRPGGTRGLPGPLWALVGIVLTNYLAQIPYSLHLYGTQLNWRGAGLLLLTLVWFVVGMWLLARRSHVGYWLTLAYLAVQVVFYFRNEVLLIPDGYGLPYHLLHARDALLWAVFLIGDVNFFAAAYFVGYMLVRRPTLLRWAESKSAYS